MQNRIIPLLVVFFAATFSVQAKLYKWVDENGQTHFGDRIPPKYQMKKHVELNEQGGVVKRYEAAETAEQRAERKRRERERKKAEFEARKQQQRDRVLLDTYTTERDLILARDSRLDAVDSQIRLAESIINDSTNNIKVLNKQIENIKASGLKVPADMFDRLENDRQQIAVHTRVVAKQRKRREEIARQFNGYIERFRTLKAEQKARREKLLRERGL